jgi:hypothetical protein
MAKQTEYAILVEPLADADGGGWLASVPALPGCMGDGETREAALADVQRTPSLNGRTQPANWDAMFQARRRWGSGGSGRRAACTKS